jgi:hypothetical protein
MMSDAGDRLVVVAQMPVQQATREGGDDYRGVPSAAVERDMKLM